MKSFANLISAIEFITILPINKLFKQKEQKSNFNPKGMIQFFPIVGAILGCLICVFDFCLFKFFQISQSLDNQVNIKSILIISLFDVISLIILTGAFHLDGLADTADGLFSHKTKQEALVIMKDSRIGTMGCVAIFCVLLIKWLGISNLSYLNYERFYFLILIPVYSRSSMLFGFKFLNYGRKSGTGKAFFNKQLNLLDFWGFFLFVIISLILSFFYLKIFFLNIFFAIIIFFILFFYKKRLNCITGDMLGAMCEVSESFLFLSICFF